MESSNAFPISINRHNLTPLSSRLLSLNFRFSRKGKLKLGWLVACAKNGFKLQTSPETICYYFVWFLCLFFISTVSDLCLYGIAMPIFTTELCTWDVDAHSIQCPFSASVRLSLSRSACTNNGCLVFTAAISGIGAHVTCRLGNWHVSTTGRSQAALKSLQALHWGPIPMSCIPSHADLGSTGSNGPTNVSIIHDKVDGELDLYKKFENVVHASNAVALKRYYVVYMLQYDVLILL